MRLKVGDPVKLFDDATGEWLGVAPGWVKTIDDGTTKGRCIPLGSDPAAAPKFCGLLQGTWGKSTVFNLLMRLYDADGGSVRLDGLDVRDVTGDFEARRHLPDDGTAAVVVLVDVVASVVAVASVVVF